MSNTKFGTNQYDEPIDPNNLFFTVCKKSFGREIISIIRHMWLVQSMYYQEAILKIAYHKVIIKNQQL